MFGSMRVRGQYSKAFHVVGQLVVLQVNDLVLIAGKEPVAAGAAGELVDGTVVEDGGVGAVGLEENVAVGAVDELGMGRVAAQVGDARFVGTGGGPFGHD